MKLKHVSRDCLKGNNQSKTTAALEGTLKKLYGFRKADDNYLEAVLKCKDFKVIFTIANFERLSVDIISNRKYLNAYDDQITIFDGKYNFNLLKKFYNRYITLK